MAARIPKHVTFDIDVLYFILLTSYVWLKKNRNLYVLRYQVLAQVLSIVLSVYYIAS